MNPTSTPQPIQSSSPSDTEAEPAVFATRADVRPHTDAFLRAADAVDYWVGQYTCEASMENTRHANAVAEGSQAASLTNLHVYQPTEKLRFAHSANTADGIHEVLEHVVEEMHELPARERGRHLAGILGMFSSDGHMDWFRFSLGHLLACYFSAMPEKAMCLGVLTPEESHEDETLVLWDTGDGLVLDVVRAERFEPPHVDVNVDAILAFGVRVWGKGFAGVRYLPLDDLDQSGFCQPGGHWARAFERDFLTLTAQFD